MAKIGILLPEAGMIDKMNKLIPESGLDVVYLKAIHSLDTVNELRRAMDAGAQIIIARGYQAKLVKEYSSIPLVEMKFQAQEIGLLIQRAKAMVKKPYPTIGLIAFPNMLCDLSKMEELFDVKLVISYLNRHEECGEVLRKMEQMNVDIIIGGEMVCREAEHMGYPTLYYYATEESLQEALISAERMEYAMENEKQNVAQVETILDTSSNGILRINTEGNITVINKLIENLIGKNNEDVIGIPVTNVFPEMDMKFLSHILKGEEEAHVTSMNIRDSAWMISIAPIKYDDKITGAIFSFQKISTASAAAKSSRNQSMMYQAIARTYFSDLKTENSEMENVLESAKIFALSESPIVFYGHAGMEEYLLAEAIHNNSNRKAGPYISINMRGMDKEKQMEALFQRGGVHEGGSLLDGAMVQANHGTLFIKGLEYMNLEVQHQILRTMLSKAALRTDAQSIDNFNVRIIASSRVHLKQLVEEGRFSEELYYMLHGLVLEIPTLNQRTEDLKRLFDEEIRKYASTYNKHIRITDGCYQKLYELPWKGNRMQLRTFCERLVLSYKKRAIDEVALQKLFDELYPNIGKVQGESKLVVYKSPESIKLRELLDRHHGNRQLAAAELGISTTTLWRRMKKYGVEASFEDN